MNKERETVRCAQCELVQWADHANCRRCGQALPAPIVNVVERVVERVIYQQDSQCLLNLQEASKLISAAAGEAGRVSCPPTDPSAFESALDCRDVPNAQ